MLLKDLPWKKEPPDAVAAGRIANIFNGQVIVIDWQVGTDCYYIFAPDCDRMQLDAIEAQAVLFYLAAQYGDVTE